MSKPTILSPWFVVMRVEDDGSVSGDYKAPEFYHDGEDEGEQWGEAEQARLFNSIHTACRIARALGAYAVVVPDEEALKEYRPKGL